MKKNSLFVANEREIVSSHLYPCTKNFASSCLAKERLLFSLKMPADAKNFHTACLYRFFKSQTSKLWLNRVSC